MKTRVLRTSLVFLSLLSIFFTGCGSGSGAKAATNQLATIKRGDLTMDIVAGGNLVLSKKQDLTFEVGGTIVGMKVAVKEVLVEEGDAVKEGQVIARLDTVPLKEALTTAERAVKNAEADLRTAEEGEFKIKNAESDLETATINFNKLNYPFTYSTFVFDIPAAIEAISAARRQIEEARPVLEAGPGDEDYGEALVKFRKAQDNLVKALERLSRGQAIDVWSSTNVSRAISDYTTARSALLAMQKAQNSLEQTKKSVQTALDKADLALEKAKNDLIKAKDDLTKAVITAPFDGFITKVNVEGGAEIQRGTVAVQLADPAKFEADVMVGEGDIFQVKEGGTAAIQVDAAPTIVLQAKVTHISPTATIQSGVVNFKVKVETEAPKSAGLQGHSQQTMPRSGHPVQPPVGGQEGTTSMSKISQLREGLSVTVNIIVAERKNVLLVPNQAITRSGRDTQVQVIKDGVAEKRLIKTGISNWQYTEVTEGLAEGEEVVIPVTTTTATTPSQTQQRPFMIPGMPRISGGMR